MNSNLRISKLVLVAELIISSMWFLLIAHENINEGVVNLLLLLFPGLRIWISFLMYYRSRLMIVPTVLLTLMAIPVLLPYGPIYHLFISPCITLLSSVSAFIGVGSISFSDYPENICRDSEYTILIGLVSCIWLILFPLGIYIYRLCKKQLQIGRISLWKCVGLCVYIFTSVIIGMLLSNSYTPILSLAPFVFMFMLIPAIFNRGDIKSMFSRAEVVFLITFAIFVVGYICGVGFELKSSITVCTLPAAFYALINWYVRRDVIYIDILLILSSSLIFWCAQYTSNIVRILLLLTTLILVAIAVIRFVKDTKKRWMSVGLYLMVAFIMPIFCLGYNPYSVINAKLLWHFDKYIYSQNGLLTIESEGKVGLRDRYGVILPIEYERVIILTPSKPYCKVKKGGKWQIFDIERHELVSDECFSNVVQYNEDIYLLKSDDGDKYLIMPRSYSHYDQEQSAVISESCQRRNGNEIFYE